MTRDQVKDVQQSFRSLAPFRDYAATTFYERLFEIDPSTKPLFAGIDMRAQGERLMASLAVIVDCLRDPKKLNEASGAKAIGGFRHGVQECHLASLGKALMAMLETLLGHDWTHELWIAWAEVYTLVSRAISRTARAGATQAA